MEHKQIQIPIVVKLSTLHKHNEVSEYLQEEMNLPGRQDSMRIVNEKAL